MSIKAYCNVTVATTPGKMETNYHIPVKVLPSGKNHGELLASLFKTLHVVSPPAHFMITKCSATEEMHEGKAVYTIFIKAVSSSNLASAKELASSVTSYTKK